MPNNRTMETDQVFDVLNTIPPPVNRVALNAFRFDRVDDARCDTDDNFWFLAADSTPMLGPNR